MTQQKSVGTKKPESTAKVTSDWQSFGSVGSTQRRTGQTSQSYSYTTTTSASVAEMSGWNDGILHAHASCTADDI